MEEDSRKKKNKGKKKKQKQSRTLEDSASIKDSESTCDDQNHAMKMGQDTNGQVSAEADVSNNVVGKVDADCNDGLANGNNVQVLLEEKVKELMNEREENLQKMANQEEKIRQLNDEKIAMFQKEEMLVANLGQVIKDNEVIIQKENYLGEKIKELQKEKEAYLQKEDSFEVSLMSQNNNIQKLQAQVMKLEDLVQGLSEEKRKLTETISSLQSQISILVSNIIFHQVDASNKEALIQGLSEEKWELTETVSSLQSQINILERNITFHQIDANKEPTSRCENIDIQTEAIHIPLENSVLENSEHIEKVISDLDHSEASVTLPADDAKFSHLPQSSSTQPLEEIMVLIDRNGKHIDGKNGEPIITNSSEDITGAGEISQISSENEEKNRSSYVATRTDEITDASLIDAPLIGAPFRFISFVARYVSGADLVKNT